MKAKELFLVGVRLFGVWMLIQAADEAVFFFDRIKRYYGASAYATYNENAYLAHGTVDLAIALVLLLCGREIMNLFPWPEDRKAANKCEQCGYDLRSGHDKCPECGTPVEQKSLK